VGAPVGGRIATGSGMARKTDARSQVFADAPFGSAARRRRVALCRRRRIMVKLALFVRLEARPGKEEEVRRFLLDGLPLVEQEPATAAWFALQLGPTTFGIFDAFPDEAGRQAHLAGQVAAALMARASELFATPPSIEKVDVLAAKLPG
jgi:quinol monooxygenase YgiN